MPITGLFDPSVSTVVLDGDDLNNNIEASRNAAGCPVLALLWLGRENRMRVQRSTRPWLSGRLPGKDPAPVPVLLWRVPENTPVAIASSAKRPHTTISPTLTA